MQQPTAPTSQHNLATVSVFLFAPILKTVQPHTANAARGVSSHVPTVPCDAASLLPHASTMHLYTRHRALCTCTRVTVHRTPSPHTVLLRYATAPLLERTTEVITSSHDRDRPRAIACTRQLWSCGDARHRRGLLLSRRQYPCKTCEMPPPPCHVHGIGSNAAWSW